MSLEIEKLERELSVVMGNVDRLTEEIMTAKCRQAYLRCQLARLINEQNNPHIINRESGS